MRVSVIATFKNEETVFREFLDALLAQTWPADDIVLCDGGSSDSSRSIIEHYVSLGHPIRLLEAPGANISTGRNQAIDAARYSTIAVTDVGCRASPGWLEALVEPLASDARTMAVGGVWEPDPRSTFELCSATLMYKGLGEIDRARYLPSSRSVAFRREVWQRAGGYPEHLQCGEDTVFDLRVRAAGYHFVLAPEAVVYWRPRKELGSFFRQFFSYARGDGRSWVSPLAYLHRLAIYVSVFVLAVVATKVWWAAVVAVTGWCIYAGRRSYRGWRRARCSACLAWNPLLVLVNDLADISGYLAGVLDRGRQRHIGLR